MFYTYHYGTDSTKALWQGEDTKAGYVTWTPVSNYKLFGTNGCHPQIELQITPWTSYKVVFSKRPYQVSIDEVRVHFNGNEKTVYVV